MKRIIAIMLTLFILLSFAVTTAHAEAETTIHSIIGDADGDRVVEIRDATFIQRYMLNIFLPFDVDKNAVDVDEDGEITILDVTNLQRWLNNTGNLLNIGQEVIPWFDKSDAAAVDYFDYARFYIIRICQTCFYAYSEEYRYLYKINGVLSDQWGLGDEVACTFENIYYPESDPEGFPHRAEADLLTIGYTWDIPDPYICYKPVIYLYPEEETEVNVQLDIDGSFTYTKPAYEDGWRVTAAPDGTLTAENGRTYPYLFWEAKLNTEYDFSKGFCVSGGDTEAFLRESLTTLGLNRKEADEFIGFWLQFMKDNPYNVISFQTSAYTDAAKLDITPQPDTTIRVFMAWYASDEAVEIPAQMLTPTQRNGFTAVEWGGQMCR